MNAANDVREGVARAIRKGFLGGMDGYDPSYEDYAMADAVMAAFDVRPRGTVTYAEVSRVQHDLGQRFHGLSYRERLIVRAALEAARGERS